MRSPLSSTEPAATAPLGQDPARLAREVLEGGNYQTDLPLGDPSSFPWHLIPTGLLSLLFWVALVVVVVVVIFARVKYEIRDDYDHRYGSNRSARRPCAR